MLKYILSFVGAWVLLTAPMAAQSDRQAELAAHKLEIIAASGARHKFNVRFAISAEQQARGLMFVRELPPMSGMVFLISPPRIARFWMHNTLLPLDMIFIAPGGKIIKITTRRDIKSQRVTDSGAPVSAVLEIAAGEAARLGVAVGDRVQHKLIKF